MNLIFSCNFIYERPKPTHSACFPRTHLFLAPATQASLKKSYSNADLHKVDLVAVGGFW